MRWLSLGVYRLSANNVWHVTILTCNLTCNWINIIIYFACALRERRRWRRSLAWQKFHGIDTCAGYFSCHKEHWWLEKLSVWIAYWRCRDTVCVRYVIELSKMTSYLCPPWAVVTSNIYGYVHLFVLHVSNLFEGLFKFYFWNEYKRTPTHTHKHAQYTCSQCKYAHISTSLKYGQAFGVDNLIHCHWNNSKHISGFPRRGCLCCHFTQPKSTLDQL